VSIGIRPEQIRQLTTIISSYENFQCVECAQAIKNYLISYSIRGKHVKLYTATGQDDRNNYIYDDSVPVEAISENGRHEAITILVDNMEIVFDNHHPNGIFRDAWMANLQFFGKIHLGQEFEITEEEF